MVKTPSQDRAAAADVDLTRLLDLATAQLDSLREDVLRFESDMSSNMQDLRHRIDQTLRTAAVDNPAVGASAKIIDHMTKLDRTAKDTVMSVQFIDGLLQRLAHAQCALELMADASRKHDSRVPRECWQQIMESLSQLYSIHAEHEVFRAVTEPGSETPVSGHDLARTANADDVELF